MSPGYEVQRRGVAVLPLALIALLHIVLVLLWATDARRDAGAGARQRHFDVVWLPQLTPRVAPLPAPAPKAAPRAVRAPVQPASRVLAPSPASPAPSAPADLPAPDRPSPDGPPDVPDAASIIDAARRQAGAVDRALRDGKPAPLAPAAELPMARFRAALESAYIDRSRAMFTEVHTQPDGVIVYRFRRGSKVWCRQSGGAGSSTLEHSAGAQLAGAGSAGGAGAAGIVPCPSGVPWARM